MKQLLTSLLLAFTLAAPAFAQTIQWEGREFELNKVTAAVVQLGGEEVLKVERDLKALPFEMITIGGAVWSILAPEKAAS